MFVHLKHFLSSVRHQMGHFWKIENLRWQEIKWCLCLECRYNGFKKLLLKCLHTSLALIAFMIYRASQACLSQSLLSTVSTSLSPFKDSYWRPYPHSSQSAQTLSYLPAFGFGYFVSANICFERFHKCCYRGVAKFENESKVIVKYLLLFFFFTHWCCS